jgi:sulfite exporter TauE/SafE
MENRKEGKILSELRKSNTVIRITLGIALIFMGLQWWPVQYNYGMKLGLSAVFLLIGIRVAVYDVKKQRENTLNKIIYWVNNILLILGVISAIILYVVSWLHR